MNDGGGRTLPAWLAITLALAVALQLVLVNYWAGFASPNERARAYQALAVVTQGSLAIDPQLARFGAMEDVACWGGRCYPNKAPGLLPLVVPAAWLARFCCPSDSVAALRWTLFGGRLLACSLPFVGTVLLLAHLLVPRFARGGRFAVAAYALATPALVASLLLFSHAFTAFCLLAAYWLWFSRVEIRPPQAALAGFLLGWAVTAEYTVAVPAAVLGCCALPRLRWRGAAAGAAGALLPIGLLAVYNAACFGAPLSLSTAHEAHAPLASLVSHGLFGISWPGLPGLLGLLFSPARGLLVWAPVFAIALGVIIPPVWRRASPGVLLLASLALVVLFSGYPNWHGGWFPGPRYLLPTLPLLCIPVAAGARWMLRWRWGRALAAATAGWGCVAAFLSLATFPFPPDDFPLPWASLSLPLAAEGIHAPSWLPGALVLPLLGALGFVAVLLLVRLAVGDDVLAGVIGVVCVVAAMSLALRQTLPATWQARLERAVVHDVYAGGRAGSLDTLLAAAQTPEQRAQVEGWIATRRTLEATTK